jgi:hypothetical protein
MTMKRTELEKRKGLAIVNAQRQTGSRAAPTLPAAVDRRAQRAAERAAGLVPFAVKLPAALVAELHARAQRDGQPLGESVAALLRAALGAPGQAV